MFIGEFQHSLDSKGRIIIPGKIRGDLGETFVLTKGMDHCLFIYAMEDWEILQEKLKALPMTDRDARAFVRFFFSGASEGSTDKQGRVLIPQNLREYADLESEGVIIGAGVRLEIWNPENWKRYTSDESLSPEVIAGRMSELGI